MDRTAKINQIIDKRKPLAKKIAQVETNLRNLTDKLYHLEERRHQLLSQIDDATTQEKLQSIDFSQFQKDIADNLGTLSKLRERFSRDTLNIGVVGRMGQGKSRLLQTLSGLTNDEIPSLEGGACTAVRSTVYHHEGETYARVVFHSQDSFLKDVIHPYFKQLELGALPKNLDEFARPLPNSLTGATNEAMYDHLKNYHQNLSRYRSLLKDSSEVIQIKKTEIPQYVTQSQAGSFYHLAVKEVRIYSRFRNTNVGKIALVDVPGLGDTKLGDEELMLKTIGQEVDVVLFVRRPDPLRYQWDKDDTDLYDIANKALRDLANRAFMVINHISQDQKQLKACQSLKDTMNPTLNQGNSSKGMKFVSGEIADCANNEEANRVLEIVLDYLVNQITEIDEKYAKIYQDELQIIHQKINAELEKTKNCLNELKVDESYLSVFLPLFHEVYETLKNQLIVLLKKLRSQRDEEDLAFKEKLEEVLNICRNDTGLPNLEQIETKAGSMGGYPNAYYDYLNTVRSHLSQHFLNLDEGLKQSLEQAKSQVADIFIPYLGNLTDERGAKFIEAIAALIPERLISGKPSKIKFGFKLLMDFDLSYRGLIQHRIRQHLDALTPNESAVIPLSNKPSADQVFLNLKTAYSEAVYSCGNTLAEILREPSQATFAIVEEFNDRIFRADGVNEEWQIFLAQNRELIWSEFEQLETNNQLKKDWVELIEKVTQANQLDSMQFLTI